MIKMQIKNPQISTEYCPTLSQTRSKVVFLMIFDWVQILKRTLYVINAKRKKYVFADLWKFWVYKSQKRLGPQIANPQSVAIAEGPQI
jgi:hypothetical protein